MLQPSLAIGSSWPRRNRIAAVLLFLLVLAAAAFAASVPFGKPVRVTVLPVENATGDPRYAPLAAAITELVSTELSAFPEVEIVRGREAASDVQIVGRLVLWTGNESVSLRALDGQSETVLWAVMVPGPAPLLPRQLKAKLPGIAGQLPER